MNIDAHLNNACRFIRQEPLYAIIGGLLVMIMNVATLGILCGPILAGYFIGIVKFMKDGKKPLFSDLFEGFQRLGYLFSYIIVGLLTLLAFLLLIVPGLIVMTWWVYVLLIMIQTNMPLSSAMAESRKKVQDKGFLMHFVFLIGLAVLPTLIINAVSVFLPPLKLLQVLVMPFQSACLVSLYLEQFSVSRPPPVDQIPD